MFCGFIRTTNPDEEIQKISANEILRPTNIEELRSDIEHKVVLIGGAWHRLGYERGAVIDSYQSPAGFIPGVLIHANYVEAVLDRRVVLPLPWWLMLPAEALLAFSLAYLLSVKLGLWVKSCSVLAVLALPIVASYVAVQNFGVYFDVFILDLLLLGH